MGAPKPRKPVPPGPLVCIGRRVDMFGRPWPGPQGEPHGRLLNPQPGETDEDLELRARVGGWRFEQQDDFDRRRRRAPGAVRSVMCPDCARRVGAPASSMDRAAS